MSFIEHFAEIEEPRSDINRKYDLLDVIFLTVCGVASGCEGWKDLHQFGVEKLEWLRQYRKFEHGIPVDDTIARIISALDPVGFTQAFINWVNEFRQQDNKELIAIDGKTLRRSFDSGDRQTALHSVTVWSKTNGIVLAQSRSEGKKNENKTVLELIDLIEMKNAIITMDAMNTQKHIAEKIREKKADYVLSLKGNHKILHTEIIDYFEHMTSNHSEKIAHATLEEIDAGHGRIEERVYRQLLVTEWITEAKNWRDMKTIVEVKRTRHLKDKVEVETQHYISSLGVDLPLICDAIRGHWSVENSAHWVLDVTYREDDCRIRRGDAAENLATARRLALNLAKLHPKKDSMRGKLKQAMWSDQFRDEIISARNLNKV